jgi:hypothetical protein
MLHVEQFEARLRSRSKCFNYEFWEVEGGGGGGGFGGGGFGGGGSSFGSGGGGFFGFDGSNFDPGDSVTGGPGEQAIWRSLGYVPANGDPVALLRERNYQRAIRNSWLDAGGGSLDPFSWGSSEGGSMNGEQVKAQATIATLGAWLWLQETGLFGLPRWVLVLIGLALLLALKK